jgi:low affinity Fe/Cu permease
MKKKASSKPSTFEVVASAVTKATGGTTAFIIAFSVIIVWVVSGPFFNFSDTWQLVINTGTTIVTFLMVFLIQRSQNKDSIALHLKLNELIVANEQSSNRLIAVEDISEEELKVLQKFYKKLAKMAKDEMSVQESHSDLVANAKHDRKSKAIRSGSRKQEAK